MWNKEVINRAHTIEAIMKINHLQRALIRCPLTPHQKITMLALVHLCDWQTWKCKVSIKHLSRETGHPLGTVKRTTRQLIELDLIKRHRQGDETGYTRSIYELNMLKLKVFLEEHIPLAHSEPTLGSDVAYPRLTESLPPRLTTTLPLAHSEPCNQPYISATNNQPYISATNNGQKAHRLDKLSRPPKPDSINPYRWNDWKEAWERSDWLSNPKRESHK